MKYYSKKTRKKKKKMIEYHSKENLSVGQLERIEKLKAKRDRLLSRGGKIERSHNKRVGNAVNKNIDKRYDAAGKAIERIEGKRKLKEDIDKNSDKYTAYYIYNKGIINNNFDFKKGFEELIKKDKDGKWICRAGKDWDQFDFKKGLDKLIQKDKKGEDIYLAGRYWNQFDYKKGLNSLKNTNYYQRALNDWPKGIDKVKEITKELRDTSTKLPNKKMKLKEEWADTVKFGSKTYEIFKNPSQKEINDIIKNDDLRYIIDGKEKAVYVFPATLLHLNAASQLGLDYDYFSNGKTIFGIDDKIQAGEKITIVGNHQRQFVELLKTQTNTEWLWKYIKKPKGLIKEEWVQSTKANKGRTYEIFKG